jgi:hypothetical protein
MTDKGSAMEDRPAEDGSTKGGGAGAPAAAPAPARRAYAVSLLLLAVYAIDVLAGKGAGLLGAKAAWRLGDVGEFLVVVAMAVAFVAGLMLSEERPARPRDGS